MLPFFNLNGVAIRCKQLPLNRRTSPDESDVEATYQHPLTRSYRIGNGDGPIDTRKGPRRSRNGEKPSPSGLKHESTLGQWTQAVDQALAEMAATQKSISNLQGIFITHADDLRMIEDTKRRLDEAEEEIRERDGELRRHEDTILTLTSMDQKSKAATESQLTQIRVDRRELEQEKTKLESRIIMATAEEKHRLNRDFEERMSRQDKSHKARMKELEVEFAQKLQENSKKATALEAEQGRMLLVIERQQKTIEGQLEE
ncbi:hypothetical protein WAI453_013191 [Rhynchosporium graminicola]